MGKFWSLLFLCVTIFGVGAFIAGPAMGVWLPINVSETGRAIDHLFMFILVLTGVVFIATEVTLFFFLWRYDAKSNTQPVKFTHGSHTLEICWTILPAATLLFIAIYQMNAWADAKMRAPNAGGHAQNFTVEVRAGNSSGGCAIHARSRPIGKRAIRWFGKDDIYDVNDLHVPVGKEVFVEPEKHGRAAQLFPAEHARQARRRAGHEDSGLVAGRKTARRGPITSTTICPVPSCAAGGITR